MNKFIIKVLRKVNAFKYLNFSKNIRIGGKNFIVPVRDNIGYSNLNTSEPWMIDVLKIVLPLGNTNFIDIGVNTGQTLLKLKSLSSNIKYIGFEPNPFCVNYVYKLIEQNSFENIILVPVGISNKTEIGVLNFLDDSKANSSASIIPEFRKGHETKRKEFIPLFDFEDLKHKINLDVISILKIDVEGSELEVITSFKKELAKSETIILLEILPAYNEQNSFRIERQNKIQEILFDLNYSIFRVIKKKDLLINLEEVKEIGIHSDLDLCDYVIVPKIKVEKFEANFKKLLNN